MVTLKNLNLELCINETGAELKSVLYQGVQYLWTGDEKFWSGSAPLLFPICGGLKEDKFLYEGKEFFLPKHGFARKSVFTLEKSTENSAVFLLKSNEETKKQYPFDFELRVIYSIEQNKIAVDYEVKNLTEGSMYFSIGAHEAYACPEGIEEYDVIFSEKETVGSVVLDGNLLEHHTVPALDNSDTLALTYRYFDDDALVFKHLKSRSAVLKNRKTGRLIKLDFEGFDYFLLWTIPDAGYICLEPWTGIPDSVDSNYDFTAKEGITKLDRGEVFKISHTIELN